MVTVRTVALALALLASAPTAVAAQWIQGTVVEEATGAVVAGAEVVLLTPRVADRPSTTTDAAGRFQIRAPRPGTYRLSVTHLSFVPYEADSVEVRGGEALMLEIRLGRGAVPLEPLVVTARRNAGMPGFDERQAAGFGRFITREDIRRRSAFRTSDLLRGVQGVTLQRVPGSDGMLVLMRSGGIGLCQPALWVDGVYVRQLPGNTMDDFLRPDIIEAIEVYASHATAPAEYSVGGCGALVVWTRRGSGADGVPWNWKKLLVGLTAALAVVWLIAN